MKIYKVIAEILVYPLNKHAKGMTYIQMMLVFRCFLPCPPEMRKVPKLVLRDFSDAVRTGLEPVTPCVTGMYSNQLN